VKAIVFREFENGGDDQDSIAAFMTSLHEAAPRVYASVWVDSLSGLYSRVCWACCVPFERDEWVFVVRPSEHTSKHALIPAMCPECMYEMIDGPVPEIPEALR
jgi:hypothetical protein